jgi:SAM-dependent methyltransferase
MSPTEIARMSVLEGEHWWYQGLRDLLQQTLEMRRFAPAAGARVLDAGCGTGANAQLLERLLKPAYLGGFDLSPLAVDICRTRVPGGDIYRSDLCHPEIHVAGLDLIVSCDAISIAGISASVPGLLRLAGRLGRGGLLILNLPAYRWLTSEHDRAIETQDRTTTSRVGRLLEGLGLSVELITYRLFCLLPAIVLARLPSILRPKAGPHPYQSDLRMPPRWINAALRQMLVAENRAICGGARLPWGSSVYAVARKL